MDMIYIIGLVLWIFSIVACIISALLYMDVLFQTWFIEKVLRALFKYGE